MMNPPAQGAAGETVEARWERAGRRMDLAEVLSIAARALDILAAAHAKGVVHGDIRPANLFLAGGGGLKVLRASTKGTSAYLAPEQASDERAAVDARTDIWGVGATMFALLSGEAVNEGGRETGAARSIATVAKGLPRSVVALVDRALKVDRAARWPDARAMKEAACGAYEALTGQPLVTDVPRAASGTSGQHRAAVPSGGFAAAPRRPSGAFEAAPASVLDPTMGAGPSVNMAPNMAPPAMSALSVDAFVAGRTAERDAAMAEVTRLSPILAEIQGRLAASRRQAAQIQEQIAAARKDRAGEEERFRRQTETRLEGLGEARKAYRRAMGDVARIALASEGAFPADVGAAERAAIEQTRVAADAQRRVAALHGAALASYDEPTLKKGLVIGIVAAVALLLLFFSPVIVRSLSSDGTGTIAPAPVTTEAPAHS